MATKMVKTHCSECSCELTAEVDYDDLRRQEKERIVFFSLQCQICGYSDTPIPPEES